MDPILDLFPPAPAPATTLGHMRRLCPLAGVHVSPLCLGGMSIGSKWARAMGRSDKESSFALLDAYYEAGGNFIDTANNYQDGSSEEFIGEWVEKRKIRDELVIATKYTTNWHNGDPVVKQQATFVGNHVKSMNVSVESSLKRLKTHYIDILYVHWWDYATPVEEVMNGLHHLVATGKVLYLGISDAPAWVVSKANMYARMTGKTPFVIYQGRWSVLDRSLERDIIPMCRSEGLALAPFGVLEGGKFRTDAEEARREAAGENGRKTFSWDSWKRTETEIKMCNALEKVAREVGAKSIQSVAIAYVMQKTPYVFPIVGGRLPEQLHANIEALEIALSPEHIAYLESVKPFELGFPMDTWGTGTGYSFLYVGAGRFEPPILLQPIRPTPQKNAAAPADSAGSANAPTQQ